VLLEKLQENERLKCELSDLQNRLDSSLSTPVTEELRPELCLSNETLHSVVTDQTHSCVTSTASEIMDGNGRLFVYCNTGFLIKFIIMSVL